MATDFLARTFAARQARRLASTLEGEGAALVGTASGAALQTLLDQGLGVPVTGIAPGEDAADAIELAASRAALTGVDVILPPFAVTLSRPVRVNRLRGTPGLSRIDVSACAMGTFPLSQFCLVNQHWSMAHDEATADICAYRGFEIASTPETPRSLLGLANVRHALIEDVTFTAHRRLGANGKPVIVDALLDFYAGVHGAKVRRCTFRQLTGAYGATRVSAGGGGCIWVRNLSSNGTLAANVTENVSVSDCDFAHYTSDECIAIYGVRGQTRKCRVSANRIASLEAADLGLPAPESIYRATLIGVFPLDDGSGANLGNTAAVHGNTLADNAITDKSTLYSTIRIGNTADAARRCENNRSERNKVAFRYWSDASHGHAATWTAAGASGSSPATACIPIRCIEGTPGLAYTGALSGNASLDDEIVTTPDSATVFCGFVGWQFLRGGRVRGSVSTGASSCQLVEGGQWEVSLRGFTNCTHVTGVSVRINAATASAHCAFHVDSSAGGTYTLSASRLHGGSMAYLAAGAGANTAINVQGCSGTLGAYDALTCTRADGTIRAGGNHMTGPSAAHTGPGTFKTAANSWGAVDD